MPLPAVWVRSKMEVQSVWQSMIPDSLLVEIFGHLDIAALGLAAQVCIQWRRVALDDILWRNIACEKFGISGNMHPECVSWHDEVKRLTYHVPSVESEVYEVHKDEVLDVAISHGGQYFCTTSKDVQATLWQLDYPSFILNSVDLKGLMNWELTQYSAFNDSDSLVFVCGVSTPSDSYIQIGSGAVFTIPDMWLVCAIDLDPPTLFGAWLTDRTFLGGSLADTQDSIKIESYEITDEDLAASYKANSEHQKSSPSCVYKTSTPVFTFRGNRYHQMNLLVANVSYCNNNRQNCDLKLLNIKDICSTIYGNNSISLSDSQPGSEGKNQIEIFDGSSMEVESCRGRNLNSFGDTAESKSIGNNCPKDGTIAMETSNADDVITTSHGINTLQEFVEDSENSIKLLESQKKLSDIKNCTASSSLKMAMCNIDYSKIDSNCDTCMSCNIRTESSAEHKNIRDLQNPVSQSINNTVNDKSHMITDSYMMTYCVSCDRPTEKRTYVVFVTGDHDAIAVHELKAEKDPYDDPTNPVAKIDHYFHLKDCYITGLSLSSDHRYLFFNYRGYDPKETINFEPSVPLYEKIFSQQLNIGTIDLTTMLRLPEREFTGHIAFSSYPAWYICLDASPNYVGSGSEDGRGYIWDIHHRVLLSKLQHKEGVVNGIAFCPNDEETCITVCDDKLVKIWRSKNRLRQIGYKNTIKFLNSRVKDSL